MLADINKYLELAFDKLNEIYFEGKLPPVAITIMSSPRSYAHISVHKIWKSDKEYYHELNLSAEYIHRNIENVMASLVHEATHLYNMEIAGIKDTSNGGRYHNSNFKKQAELRDLKIDYDKTIGWSITSPTSKFIQTLKDNGLYGDGINLYRITGRSLDPKTGGGLDGTGGGDGVSTGGSVKKPSSTRKYICIQCGLSVRATKDVRLICMDCDVMLVKTTA